MGPTVLAPLQPAAAAAAAALAATLSRHGLPTTPLPPDLIRPLRWSKVAVNAVLNPAAALAGCTNGEAAAVHTAVMAAGPPGRDPLSPDPRSPMGALAREVGAAMLAALPGEQSRGLARVPGWAGWADAVPVGDQRAAGLYVLRASLATARATSGNVCSTLSDLRGGRPTEAEFVSGWVAAAAAAGGMRAQGCADAAAALREAEAAAGIVRGRDHAAALDALVRGTGQLY
jgi:hypothetical protein